MFPFIFKKKISEELQLGRHYVIAAGRKRVILLNRVQYHLGLPKVDIDFFDKLSNNLSLDDCLKIVQEHHTESQVLKDRIKELEKGTDKEIVTKMQELILDMGIQLYDIY